jgi:hypothetical protein
MTPGTVLATNEALRDKGNEVDFVALRGLVNAMST